MIVFDGLIDFSHQQKGKKLEEKDATIIGRELHDAVKTSVNSNILIKLCSVFKNQFFFFRTPRNP